MASLSLAVERPLSSRLVVTRMLNWRHDVAELCWLYSFVVRDFVYNEQRLIEEETEHMKLLDEKKKLFVSCYDWNVLHISIMSFLFSVLAALAFHLLSFLLDHLHSFLRITDRSFHYASPFLWNQLSMPPTYKYLYFWLTYSCAYHFFLCWLTSHQSPHL